MRGAKGMEKEKAEGRKSTTKRKEINEEMWNLSGLSEREEKEERRIRPPRHPLTEEEWVQLSIRVRIYVTYWIGLWQPHGASDRHAGVHQYIIVACRFLRSYGNPGFGWTERV